MGFVSGFIYKPGVESDCANDIFTYLESWVNAADVVKKLYMPWNWPPMQVVL